MEVTTKEGANYLLCELGFEKEWQQNLVNAGAFILTLAAISAVVIGILGQYNVISASNALWGQVGMFAAAGIAVTVTLLTNSGFKNNGKKMAIVLGAILATTLPILFGSLGATGFISAHNMLWAGTAIGATVGLASFVSFSVTNCCYAEDS